MTTRQTTSSHDPSRSFAQARLGVVRCSGALGPLAPVVVATEELAVVLAGEPTVAVGDDVVALAAVGWLVAVGVDATAVSNVEEAAHHAGEGPLAGGLDGPRPCLVEQDGFELCLVEPGGHRRGGDNLAGGQLAKMLEPLRTEHQGEQRLGANAVGGHGGG